MQYRVRDHFFVHLEGFAYPGGTLLELTEEQAELHAAQIEQVEQASSCTPKRRKAADGVG